MPNHDSDSDDSFPYEESVAPLKSSSATTAETKKQHEAQEHHPRGPAQQSGGGSNRKSRLPSVWMGWGEGGDDESPLGESCGHRRLNQQEQSNGSIQELVHQEQLISFRGSPPRRRNSRRRFRSTSPFAHGGGDDENTGARNDWFSSREWKSISPNAQGTRSFVDDGNSDTNNGVQTKQKSTPYFMPWGSKQSFSSHEDENVYGETDIVSSFIAGIGSAIHNSLSSGENGLADEEYGKSVL